MGTKLVGSNLWDEGASRSVRRESIASSSGEEQGSPRRPQVTCPRHTLLLHVPPTLHAATFAMGFPWAQFPRQDSNLVQVIAPSSLLCSPRYIIGFLPMESGCCDFVCFCCLGCHWLAGCKPRSNCAAHIHLKFSILLPPFLEWLHAWYTLFTASLIEINCSDCVLPLAMFNRRLCFTSYVKYIHDSFWP